MTNRPNLVAGDAEGNPLEDTDHLVNGRVPGTGGEGYWTSSDGTLEPTTEDGSVSVEQTDIDFASIGSAYTVRPTEGDTYAVLGDRGQFLAGGPDHVNVSDATDFAEIWEWIDSDAGTYYSLELTNANPSAEGISRYMLKSTANLDNVHILKGQGRNRTQISVEEDMADETVISIDRPSSSWILRWDSFKFSSEAEEDADFPDTWADFNGVKEVLLTNVEFRDAKNWGLDAADNHRWNYIQNCWFLAGAGLSFREAGDLAFGGNIIRNADIELIDCERVAWDASNVRHVDVSFNIENVEIEPRRLILSDVDNDIPINESVSEFDDRSYSDRMRVVEDIGQDAEIIANAQGQNVTWVVGEDDNGDEFRDHVYWRHWEDATVDTVNETGEPRGREYSVDSSDLLLEAVDGSFDVTVHTNSMR